jgi:hypothetical protein
VRFAGAIRSIVDETLRRATNPATSDAEIAADVRAAADRMF